MIRVLALHLGIATGALVTVPTVTTAQAQGVKQKTVDSIAQDVFVEIALMAKSWEKVLTVEEAKTAIAKSNKHADAMVKLAAQLQKLPRPDNAKRQQIAGRFQKRQDILGEKMAASMMMLQRNPAAMKVITDGMKGIGQKLKASNGVFARYFYPDQPAKVKP